MEVLDAIRARRGRRRLGGFACLRTDHVNLLMHQFKSARGVWPEAVELRTMRMRAGRTRRGVAPRRRCAAAGASESCVRARLRASGTCYGGGGGGPGAGSGLGGDAHVVACRKARLVR